MLPQYGELQPSGWDRFGSLGHPSKFQRVSRLSFVTAARSFTGDQPNFARCLVVSCAAKLFIHFRGLLPPNGILTGAKFTFRPNLAFSYTGSMALEQCALAKLCGAQQRAPPIFDRSAITLGIGPHSSYEKIHRISPLLWKQSQLLAVSTGILMDHWSMVRLENVIYWKIEKFMVFKSHFRRKDRSDFSNGMRMKPHYATDCII